MKKYILIFVFGLMSQTSFSQEENNKGILETSFEVDGVCGMCKERIENAVLRSKGVKLASWDIESHELKVTYKASKVTEDELHEAVNAVGHDTEKSKASDEVYQKIHPCCHYRDEGVINSHKK